MTPPLTLRDNSLKLPAPGGLFTALVRIEEALALLKFSPGEATRGPLAPPEGGYHMEVFYDGHCPMCMREIRALMRLDLGGHIRFTDFASGVFDPAEIGKSPDELTRRTHARLPTGEIISGMDVMRTMCSILGLHRVARFSRVPVLSTILTAANAVFSHLRRRNAEGCEEGCCGVPSTRLPSPSRRETR